VRIRSISTGRARVGYAFDWLLPYVTGGVALVNAEDTLTLSTEEGTQIFPGLSNSNMGYAVGGGFDIALSSNLSARLEYLRITTNISSTVPVPGAPSVFATEAATYRDNIVRIGLNYRIGPRGGPGVLETARSPYAYALNYNYLPDAVVFADKAKPAKPPQEDPVAFADKSKPAKPSQDKPTGILTADAAPESSSILIQRPASGLKNFSEIGALADADTNAKAEAPPPKTFSKNRRENEQDESKRLKRIMTICAC
jgi:hypothetical protein